MSVVESRRKLNPADLPPLYGSRSRTFEWRQAWFAATRGSDLELLTRLRDQAFNHKLQSIEKRGRESGAIAGYDPAGAGSPWYPIGPRNVNGRVKSLAVHPTDPNTVYAGAASGGVWKSVDGGQTWDSLWDMQESIALGGLAIAPGTPNMVYAGSGEWTPGWGPSYGGAGLYVSTDSGGTWSRRTAVVSRRIGKIVVDPGNDQRLWVCGDAGLERSTDGGTTWTILRAPTVSDITLDPTNANVVYIGVRYGGFYKSTDGGTTFALLPGSPTGAGVEWPLIAVGVSGTHANNFLVIKTGGTMQTSIDAGATFTAVPGAHGGFYAGWCDALACAPDNEQILFWGGVGLDRTANGGTTWAGLPVHADQHAVVFAPSNLNVVYVANDGGVWRSDDKGATIRKVSNGLVITQFYNLGFWSTLSNVIGGGAQDNATNYTTSGLTWRPVWTNDGGWFVIDPTDPRIMYAEGQNAYLAKSSDGGASWSTITSGVTGATPWEGVLTMDPNNHLTLFYGTNSVLRTLDGASTAWTASSQALAGEVSAIAIAPSNSNRVYAAAGGHLYRSNDGGNTSPWADITGALPGRPISSVYVDPTNADHILVSIAGTSAAASSQSVYETTTGGAAWTDRSGDLPKVVGNSVVLDPSSATTLYLATDTGLYRTTNGGVNWLPFDNGIPNVPVSDLTVDAGLKMLYAATMGRGAYKLDITPAVTKAQVDLYLRDDDLDTGERIPSPSGLPDPLLPAPAQAAFWMSPDIKVNHAPAFSPPGVFDGVDFDTTLIHQDAFRGQVNRFYLQVHNRGWKLTNNVSVRAFVADASAGLPDLPNALVPPLFDLANLTTWQSVGAAQTIPTLKPNRPVIVYWDYEVPAGQATHTCCLAVVSSADDPFNSVYTNIAQLVTLDKRACLKNLHIVDPGPSPMGSTMTTIDFHNPLNKVVLIDIVIRPTEFSRGRIGLLLPKVALSAKGQSEGVTEVPLRPGDPIGSWYLRPGVKVDEALTRRFEECDRSRIFEFDSSRVTALRGIQVPAVGTIKGIVVSSHKLDVPTIAPPRFDVIQEVGGKVAGAATFQVGYDPVLPAQQRSIKHFRIIGERMHFGEQKPKDRDRRLWLEVRLGDDPNRTYFRPIRSSGSHANLFDGYALTSDSLALSFKESDGDESEGLWAHHFEPGMRSWLGIHEAAGRDQLRFTLHIVEIDDIAVPAAD
jgi:photosystem II stability/assembly factor-like uncharacterized protein